MQIEKLEKHGLTTLKISGEVDLHASPELRATLLSCAKAKVPCLLLDFTDVAYIDSSGLATLIEYAREIEPFAGKLALFGLQKKVRTIFDLVRLNELFVIGVSAEEALAVLKAK